MQKIDLAKRMKQIFMLEYKIYFFSLLQNLVVSEKVLKFVPKKS